MATVEMTLYEALMRKKTLENRVSNLSRVGSMVGILKGTDPNVQGAETTRDGTVEEAKSAYQSARDQSVTLFQNFVALRAAINEANAKTEISIGDRKYTIANAIARYKSIDGEIGMYNAILRNIQSVKNEVAQYNAKYMSPEAIDKHISAVLSDAKRDADLVDKLTKNYIADNTRVVYDPLNMEKTCQEEIERLTEFKEQMHFKLNEVNCQTKIQVEFAD
jgi:hypothetical protein